MRPKHCFLRDEGEMTLHLPHPTAYSHLQPHLTKILETGIIENAVNNKSAVRKIGNVSPCHVQASTKYFLSTSNNSLNFFPHESA